MSSFKIGDVPEEYYDLIIFLEDQSVWIISISQEVLHKFIFYLRHLSRQPEIPTQIKKDNYVRYSPLIHPIKAKTMMVTI